MSALLVFPVALPLAGAAFVALADESTPEELKDIPAMLIAAATTVLSAVVLVRSERMTLVHWFGGWHPRQGLAVGIGFVAEPLGAGLAVLAGVLVTAALVFSWHYMEEAPRLYRVLMLVFLGGISGFALSGDLFNMFVWFELMGVAAYALAGYMVEKLGPLQGALNFAITNSVGAFMILFGVALLYGGTGALNLAQIGRALGGRPAHGLVIVAFTLLASGLLVKSALAPFHLWLADAYAVAPAPVCVVFAGAMSEVGLFGLARIYWTVFDPSFAPHAAAVRNVLLVIGIATALLGAVMAFLQRHLKRLLAYTVISHVGVTLCGIALLTSGGLASAANLVLAHGFLTAGLFLACGVLLREFHTVDELNLRGRGRALPVLGLAFGIGAFALIGFPYAGSFLGHSELDEAALQHGHAWLPPLVMVAAGISAGAVLRGAARVFLGWGPSRDPLLTPEPKEDAPEEEANRTVMVGVVVGLIVVGLLLSVAPGLQDRTEHAAERFRDRHAYVARTLFGEVRHYGPSAPVALHRASTTSIGYGIGATVVALGTVLFGLFRRRLPEAFRTLGARTLEPAVNGLKAVHTGIVGDYVMWITAGTAVIGAVWAITLRGP
jgi:multicomponent Na+:H+ antiporter subunit D